MKATYCIISFIFIILSSCTSSDENKKIKKPIQRNANSKLELKRLKTEKSHEGGVNKSLTLFEDSISD